MAERFKVNGLLPARRTRKPVIRSNTDYLALAYEYLEAICNDEKKIPLPASIKGFMLFIHKSREHWYKSIAKEVQTEITDVFEVYNSNLLSTSDKKHQIIYHMKNLHKWTDTDKDIVELEKQEKQATINRIQSDIDLNIVRTKKFLGIEDYAEFDIELYNYINGKLGGLDGQGKDVHEREQEEKKANIDHLANLMNNAIDTGYRMEHEQEQHKLIQREEEPNEEQQEPKQEENKNKANKKTLLDFT